MQKEYVLMDFLTHQQQSTFLESRWLALSCPWELTSSESPLIAAPIEEIPHSSGCISELQDELWMTEKQNMLVFYSSC